ncbi:cytochrome c [Aquamicrobium sp.]|uniref:c-type cytochrome n=1 Tax=Aquamicrobium sp. TaxID=1872579 RepID=UPI00349E856F
MPGLRPFLFASFMVAVLPSLAQESAAQEEDANIAYGRALVEANCAACHGIDTADESRHPDAPPFRTLWERYPIDALEESFVEGIATGHPDMPQFTATPEQIAAILDYIASLQP